MSEDFEKDEFIYTVDGIRYFLTYGVAKAWVTDQYSDDIGKCVKIPAEIIDREGCARKVTKICDNAFSGCKNLEIIDICDNIEEIGEWAFSDCENLKTVKLPNAIKEIKNSTFDDCKSLETIVSPDCVTKIERNAFSGCEELIDLILPEELTFIGDNAFGNCGKLKSVYISSTVEKIGDKAFDHCDSLEDIQVDSANPKFFSDGKRLITKDKNNKVLFKCKNAVDPAPAVSPKRKKNANTDKTFAEGKKIKSMLNKNGYTYFLGHDYTAAIVEYKVRKDPPKYLQIPGEVDNGDGITYKVTEIYGTTFFHREELEVVEIPEGVEVIGGTVFADCKNLKKVIMPNTVKKLGLQAFSGCLNLTEINLSNSLKTLEKDTFFGCNSITTLVLPDSVEEIEERAFGCSKGITQITLSSSLKTIGSQAFSHCQKLESLYIPASVEDITGDIFQGCSSLESLVVDTENKKYYSAGNCVMEKSANRVVAGCVTSKIPYGVTEIAPKAFFGSQIRKLNIPESVVKIGDKAFAWSGLYEIYIPKSVAEIGDGAFDDCYTRLRCGAKEKPSGWSQYMGLKPINYTTWNLPVPLVIIPEKKKVSIFKKIKDMFAKIFKKK